MKVKLTDISNDTTIQCRAHIDMEVINSYAERMTDGDVFPPVELFSDGVSFWIADGWHRVMAAKQIGANDIEANVTNGSRVEALKVALKANSVHGLRRSNEDKRRCVQVACAEFPFNSNRQIADMCGVSHTFVDKIRLDVATVATSPEPVTRPDTLGRQQPAHKPPRPAPADITAAPVSPSAFNPFAYQPPCAAPEVYTQPDPTPAPATAPARAFKDWTPTPSGQPVARPPWLPPDDGDAAVTDKGFTPQQREESSCLKPEPKAEWNQTQISENSAPKEEESMPLRQLKIYWNMADLNAKNAFVLWVKANKERG